MGIALLEYLKHSLMSTRDSQVVENMLTKIRVCFLLIIIIIILVCSYSYNCSY